LGQLGTKIIFFKDLSQTEPLAQTLKMIELSRAKGLKLRNDRAEPVKLKTIGSSFDQDNWLEFCSSLSGSTLSEIDPMRYAFLE
jgi:hypothetical protein